MMLSLLLLITAVAYEPPLGREAMPSRGGSDESGARGGHSETASWAGRGHISEVRRLQLRAHAWTGECSSSCKPNTPGCPLTVDAERCRYMATLVEGNLVNLIANGSAAEPAGHSISRDLPSGALSALITQCPQPLGCCAPSKAACMQPPPPPVCDAAMALLRRFGGCESKPGAPPEDKCGSPGTSFGGQAYPLLWHAFGDSCFAIGSHERAFLLAAINASLPSTKAAATPQEVSYTNMYLMSTVNSILFGEIVGGTRGDAARDVGYKMWDIWRSYTKEAGIHEFTSPTYSYVQLTALYPAFIYAARPGARQEFGAALDLLWADLSANTFPPRGALSGPHSRDYDQLVGHGMVHLELYFWGLDGVTPLHCERDDPHCEVNHSDTTLCIPLVILYPKQTRGISE
jgi:hypothetical protein